jgi:hypothetical protein
MQPQMTGQAMAAKKMPAAGPGGAEPDLMTRTAAWIT